MEDWKRRLLGLGLPCLMAFLLDTGLRLRAQPEKYWAGDYHYILQEGSPFLRFLFAWHPAAAIAGYGLWAAIIAGLLLCGTHRCAFTWSRTVGSAKLSPTHPTKSNRGFRK